MPQEKSNASQRAGESPKGYRYASHVVENPGSEHATFGVQFCLKPSKYHLQGGGSVWEGRGPLCPIAKDLENDADKPQPANGVQEMDIDDDDISIVTTKKPNAEGTWRNLFVTCNANCVRVYEARKKLKPLLLQLYEDEDPKEEFYCVAWTYNADGNHEWWACAAGKKGVVRILNVQKASMKTSLAGHGEAINDLKVHPRDPALLITASKDESLRLWNLRTGSTVAVFAGLKGHRGEVVHVDFDRDGKRFASCGIDNSVRIWDADEAKVIRAIKESHEAADLGVEDTYVYRDKTGTRKKTKVPICQFPYFVTRKVHKHYVDCVMWVGDLLLSKSVHNRIFLWEPTADRESLSSPASNYTLLEEYVLSVCHVWFIRFAMDRSRRLMACGNDKVSRQTHFWFQYLRSPRGISNSLSRLSLFTHVQCREWYRFSI